MPQRTGDRGPAVRIRETYCSIANSAEPVRAQPLGLLQFRAFNRIVGAAPRPNWANCVTL